MKMETRRAKEILTGLKHSKNAVRSLVECTCGRKFQDAMRWLDHRHQLRHEIHDPAFKFECDCCGRIFDECKDAENCQHGLLFTEMDRQKAIDCLVDSVFGDSPIADSPCLFLPNVDCSEMIDVLLKNKSLCVSDSNSVKCRVCRVYDNIGKCKHCGSKATVEEKQYNSVYSYMHIECSNCHIRSTKESFFTKIERSRTKAIKKLRLIWNRKANDSGENGSDNES